MGARRALFPAALGLALSALALLAPGAGAAGAPLIGASYATEVGTATATLRAEINPNGLATSYRFEYLTEAAYAENVAAARDPFTGAVRIPVVAVPLGSGSAPVSVLQHPPGLKTATAYRYRASASNTAGSSAGPARPLATRAAAGPFALPEGRAWELVSPADKGGGSVQGPEANFGGGVFQAAADGGSFTYSSADSFAGGVGAPPASQYLATRTPASWVNQNLSTPLLSGSYGDEPDGVPYRIFSNTLDRGLLSNGERCRGQAGGSCPVANPPLPGSGAPGGYRDYYLRDGAGGFEALVKSGDLEHGNLEADEFEVRLAGAPADLSHLVLESCAALTADATEAPAAGGCDEAQQNLYLWSPGSGLALLNLLPAAATGTPGAELAAPIGAISADGSRTYLALGGSLYLREGSQTKLLPQSAGASFQAASGDGRFAFFTAAAHLYRYDALAGTASDLTPAGGVTGVLGAAPDGAVAYYQDAAGLWRWSAGGTVAVAAGANAAAPSDYSPPATGTARVSVDGSRLAFLSAAPLTTYPSEGVTELYVYGPSGLLCASCRPSGERPGAAASIPGAPHNGTATPYKPRALSADGNRVFFDSADALVFEDTDNRVDVYEWRAQGIGGCGRALGCVALISSGRGGADSRFLDASADGADAFFLTEASLVAADPGAFDVYDARVGGGQPQPLAPVPCAGDACQILPAAPEDPSPGTLLPGNGNPPLRIVGAKKKQKHHKKKAHQKRKHHHAKHGKGGGR